jgi:hypothetical protein
MSELAQLIDQMRQLTEASQTMGLQLQMVQGQNVELGNRVNAKDLEVQALQAAAVAAAAAHGQGAGAGQASSALVQKWAPSEFSGDSTLWKDWSLKFRSYMGSLLRGELGRWLEHIDDNLETSAKIAVLGEQSRAASTAMQGALIATCQGRALVIVQRAGTGEGLEAWRELLSKYEPRSKQSKVMRLCEVLGFDFKQGDLLDSLERFESAVAEYEKEAGKVVDDDIKIGVVIRGIDKGSLREHLLLHSERAATFSAFRAELDTIARAQSASMLTSSPMDIGAMGKGGKGGGKDGKFTGTCHTCGKTGHRAADCWSSGGKGKSGGGSKGGGKGKGSGKGKNSAAEGKACFQCGVTGHFKSECRASAEKIKRFKDSGGGGNKKSFKKLNDDGGGASAGDIGHFDFCQISKAGERQDESGREIIFVVDSAACRTVVPLEHQAAR